MGIALTGCSSLYSVVASPERIYTVLLVPFSNFEQVQNLRPCIWRELLNGYRKDGDEKSGADEEFFHDPHS